MLSSSTPLPPAAATTAAPRTFTVDRAATESPSDGQYYSIATPAALSLTITDRTLSLATSNGAPLLSLPLVSCLFGATDDKLLLIPLSRAPAWLLEMKPKSEEQGQTAGAADAAAALRQLGCVVDGAPDAPSPFSMAALEAAVAEPGFMEQLAQMEAALTRRECMGLPDLLALAPIVPDAHVPTPATERKRQRVAVGVA